MKVSEIFCSIQGEGPRQGQPTVFIRLAGCNLACAWCDTTYARSGGTEMSAAEILAAIAGMRPHRVCITGGEPLLQCMALVPLLASLCGHGYSVEIETNGTVDPSNLRAFASITMDVKCPSSGEASRLEFLDALGTDDAVKFVVADRADLEYMDGVVRSHRIRAPVFVSPVWGTDLRPIADYILEQNLPVRMQVQLHRLVGVR
ncbi:MAG: radical SAM protein [Methanospirillum sp.]|nr:radical SAM protein [Methanospirillum sp.]